MDGRRSKLSRARPVLLLALTFSCASPSPRAPVGPPVALAGVGASEDEEGEMGRERGLTLASDESGESEGSASEMTEALRAARGSYARRIGVAIGINEYRGSVPRLGAAVSDAERMAELFRAAGFHQVFLLTDQEATREGILDLLERKVPLVSGERDQIVVFFAGHGQTSASTKGYIIPVDGTMDVVTSGIGMQRLKESALRMKARHVLFVIDACFSGSMLTPVVPAGALSALSYWNAQTSERLIQVMTAGEKTEKVRETGGWGVFTRSIHEGLTTMAADDNGDGVVTSFEMFSYASKAVTKTGLGQQHPQFGTLEGQGANLFWDERRIPKAEQLSSFSRELLPGKEPELRKIHQLLEKQDFRRAEAALRDLMLKGGDPELNLLLAEVYVGADVVGNRALIEAELAEAEAEKVPLTEGQQERLLTLRALTQRAQRGAF